MITSKERKHIISKAADIMLVNKPTARIRLTAYCEGYFTGKPVAPDEIEELVDVAIANVEAVLEDLKGGK